MQVSIEAAAKTLPELIEAVRNGQEVVILDGDRPVARLETALRSGFRFGIMADLLQDAAPDFLEPMDRNELALWEGRDDERC